MFILIIYVMTNILFRIRFLIDDIIYRVKFVTLSLLLIKGLTRIISLVLFMTSII